MRQHEPYQLRSSLATTNTGPHGMCTPGVGLLNLAAVFSSTLVAHEQGPTAMDVSVQAAARPLCRCMDTALVMERDVDELQDPSSSSLCTCKGGCWGVWAQ